MNGEKAKASAQYNDVQGTVAADWRDNTNRLSDFAQSQAVDLQGYIPVGISAYLVEPKGSELDTASVSIFAVDPTRAVTRMRSDALWRVTDTPVQKIPP